MSHLIDPAAPRVTCSHARRTLSMDGAYLYCAECGYSWPTPANPPRSGGLQPLAEHVLHARLAALEARLASLEERMAALLPAEKEQ